MNGTPVKTRLVSLQCEPSQASELAQVIRSYALAAYPPGGSECAQVAREALLDAASQIAGHQGGLLQVRKRLLPQLRAAVRWCLTQDAPAELRCSPELATVLQIQSKSTD
ncbi:MAG: hypothetical protein KDI82_10450 [Gammaproteobacteria bacterium]|nr:hypothetical protein [Gammaproteobacteria bacterium]